MWAVSAANRIFCGLETAAQLGAERPFHFAAWCIGSINYALFNLAIGNLVAAQRS